MNVEQEFPGTAAYYDKHIYPDLGVQTLLLGSESPHSSGLTWFFEREYIDPSESFSLLEIGCGAGRNLKGASKLFPNATLFGFDGSPLALSYARKALPDIQLAQGDFHDTWPFNDTKFKVILDIASGIPESTTEEQLHQYTSSLYDALEPGGYALVVGITPNDGSSKQFRGEGTLVYWEKDGDIKPERLITFEDATAFYKDHGFAIKDSHIYTFEATAFGEKRERELLYLAIQKPHIKINDLSYFAPIDQKIVRGYTNNVEIVQDSTGNVYVQKTLREGKYNHSGFIQFLKNEELPAIGFEGSVTGRTMREQKEFTEKVAALGLPVVVPVYADEKTLILPFIPGETFLTHLQEGNTQVIKPVLESLRCAHASGVTYGDRWPGNVIITEDKRIKHIDFEIATEGKYKAELELAQMVYAISGISTEFEDAKQRIAEFTHEHSSQYDWDQVSIFLQKYEAYFTNHPNGKRMERAKYILGHKLGIIISMIESGV